MNCLVKKYNNFRKSRFITDIAIVVSGTAIAQIISIAFSPILTRLYGPEAFGILGVFVAMVAMITPLKSLSYTMAIVIPKSDNDARILVRLSIFIAIGIASLLALILWIFHTQVAHLFGLKTSSYYLMLIPIIVIFNSAEYSFSQWLIRKKQFRSISVTTIAHTALTNVAKTVVGVIFATAPVLIIINTIGQAFHAFLLWVNAKSSFLLDQTQKQISIERQSSSLKTIAYRYRDYPIYRAPQNFFHNTSQNIPVLLIAAFFGPVPAGYYALTKRVLKLPSTLISASVTKVLLPILAESAHNGINLRPLILKATAGLALIGLFPYGFLIAFGPSIFSFVFGVEWSMAGEYARWLSIWLFFMLVNGPCIQAIPLLGLQAQFLVYEVILIAVSTASLAFGAIILKSDIIAVALFSISGAILNIILLIWVFINSKDRLREDFR